MADPKIAASRNFSERVYRDEPILIPARQMGRFTPPRIREMRQLARAGGTDARLFVEQGRFMASYEDDCEYTGEFSQYFPTYQAMNDAQLRGYFTWRTGVRGGTVAKTSLSFAFVHIYELLNQIGVDSPEAGFHALKTFWTAYRELDPRINAYVPTWLRDYVVYNNLDKSLLADLPDGAFHDSVAVLLDHGAHGADAVFAALNALSSYDLENSRFYRQYPDDVRAVVHAVYSVIADYYNRNPRQGAREKLFGRVCVSSYSMFKSAVFQPRSLPGRREYEIGNCHKYTCENGNWSCERFVWYGINNKRIGAILKTVDFLMRRSRDYKSSLQPGKTNKILTGKIEKEIARYERWKRENTPAAIDIDVAKLHGIRTAALATQNRLLVDGPAEDEPPAATPTQLEPEREHASGLDATERRLMHCLLYGTDYAAIVRATGVPLSVIVDGINDKLFDAFGDTVIADAGDGPEAIDDYLEELKGMFPQ